MSKTIFGSFVILVLIASSLVIAQNTFQIPSTTTTFAPPTTPSSIVASSEIPDQEIDLRIRNFFSNLSGSTGNSTAFEELLKSGPLGASLDPTGYVKMQADFDKAKTQLGLYRGNERIDMKSIGKDLVVARYLYKGELAPMIWYFTFYRPASSAASSSANWFVISVRFDSNLEYVASTL